MTSFGLATIRDAESDLETALVIDQWLYPLASLESKFRGHSIMDLLQDWEASYNSLRRLALSIDIQNEALTRILVKDANLVTPIRFPNKLLAVGANYASHLKEMGVPPERWDPIPFFSCPPTTSIVGPGKTVPMPPGTQRFDWECELTVVIGKSIKDATVEEAKDAIAGYTIGLDLSCRDLFKGSFGLTDIIRGKAQPGMKPCGPFFWPKQCVANLDNAPVKLWLNEELVMNGSTNEMIRSMEECVSEMSCVLPLEPGDMIMTGTPAGSAAAHGDRWLRKGDCIKAQVAGLEPLEVEIY